MKLNIVNSETNEFLLQNAHPSIYFDNIMPVVGDIIAINIPKSDKMSIYLVKERRFFSIKPNNSITLFVEELEEYDL